MPTIQGTAVATFDNEVPILLQGEWTVGVGIPAFRAYGQGNGKPGKGYIGSALGTKKDVSGTFNFVVDQTGELIKAILQKGIMGFFTMAWPIGDPDQGASKGQAIDCHFDRLEFKENNPEGQYIITGTMSAGDVIGEIFDELT